MGGTAADSSTMRVLTLDIETSPNLADVWGLWQQNVSLSQLRECTRVISFAAKWHDSKTVEFYSDFHDGHLKMVKKAHELLDQADVVVHYNGTSFDIPHLKREFLLAGLRPPSPYKQVDLLKVVRGNFRFVSNKLDHVSQELGIGKKTKHAGHELWVKCLAGDARAWDTMRKYNKHDVVLTEKLYDRLVPWISNHPHHGLFTGKECCQRCGSEKLQRRGLAYTTVGVFQRFQCQKCGGWSRGAKSISRVGARSV